MLGNIKAEGTRRADFGLGIKGALLDVFNASKNPARYDARQSKTGCHSILHVSDVRHGAPRQSSSFSIENRQHQAEHRAR